MNFEYDWHCEEIDFDKLKGLKLISITGLEKDSDEVFFNTECGKQFKMYHEQDCCESVDIDDVCGDVDDLIDCLIVHAEERFDEGDDTDYGTSTHTFYDIQTTKGSVNIKWIGESNGYYSESVNFCEGKKVLDD